MLGVGGLPVDSRAALASADSVRAWVYRVGVERSVEPLAVIGEDEQTYPQVVMVPVGVSSRPVAVRRPA